MGYEEVETYGFDPQGIGYYGLPAKDVRAAPAGQQTHDLQRPLRSESVHVVQRRRHEALRRPLHRRRPRPRAGRTSPGRCSTRAIRTIEKFKIVAERLNIGASRSRRPGCNWPTTITISSSSSRTGRSDTTSSSRKRIQRWSSCRWICTGSRTDRSSPPTSGSSGTRPLRDVACQGHAQDQS